MSSADIIAKSIRDMQRVGATKKDFAQVLASFFQPLDIIELSEEAVEESYKIHFADIQDRLLPGWLDRYETRRDLSVKHNKQYRSRCIYSTSLGLFDDYSGYPKRQIAYFAIKGRATRRLLTFLREVFTSDKELLNLIKSTGRDFYIGFRRSDYSLELILYYIVKEEND